MANLSVKICGVNFKNPVIAASGTYGFGREFDEIYDISSIGGISTKGMTNLPRVGNPVKTKIKGKFDPGRKQFGEIGALLDSAFMPIAAGKKEFCFIAIVDRGGKYSAAPMPSIGAAAKETLFSLSSMIDRIPRKQQKLREKILHMQQRITTALDMDD